MRRRKKNPDVATYGEVWKGLKSDLRKAPRGLFEIIFSLDTYLLLACFVAVPTIYYVGTALLFSYLPGRLYGAVKQSWVWDSLLGLLLTTMAGLYMWGKYVQPRRKQAERLRRLQRLRGELGKILERVAEVVAEKGKKHPETGYVYRELGTKYRELGQLRQARRVHREESEIFRETLGEGHPEVRFWGERMDEPEPLRVVAIQAAPGSRPQDVGDLFDGRTTLLALGVILGGIMAMTVGSVGLGFGIELFLSFVR